MYHPRLYTADFSAEPDPFGEHTATRTVQVLRDPRDLQKFVEHQVRHLTDQTARQAVQERFNAFADLLCGSKTGTTCTGTPVSIASPSTAGGPLDVTNTSSVATWGVVHTLEPYASNIRDNHANIAVAFINLVEVIHPSMFNTRAGVTTNTVSVQANLQSQRVDPAIRFEIFDQHAVDELARINFEDYSGVLKPWQTLGRALQTKSDMQWADMKSLLQACMTQDTGGKMICGFSYRRDARVPTRRLTDSLRAFRAKFGVDIELKGTGVRVHAASQGLRKSENNNYLKRLLCWLPSMRVSQGFGERDGRLLSLDSVTTTDRNNALEDLRCTVNNSYYLGRARLSLTESEKLRAVYPGGSQLVRDNHISFMEMAGILTRAWLHLLSGAPGNYRPNGDPRDTGFSRPKPPVGGFFAYHNCSFANYLRDHVSGPDENRYEETLDHAAVATGSSLNPDFDGRILTHPGLADIILTSLLADTRFPGWVAGMSATRVPLVDEGSVLPLLELYASPPRRGYASSSTRTPSLEDYLEMIDVARVAQTSILETRLTAFGLDETAVELFCLARAAHAANPGTPIIRTVFDAFYNVSGLKPQFNDVHATLTGSQDAFDILVANAGTARRQWFKPFASDNDSYKKARAFAVLFLPRTRPIHEAERLLEAARKVDALNLRDLNARSAVASAPIVTAPNIFAQALQTGAATRKTDSTEGFKLINANLQTWTDDNLDYKTLNKQRVFQGENGVTYYYTETEAPNNFNFETSTDLKTKIKEIETRLNKINIVLETTSSQDPTDFNTIQTELERMKTNKKPNDYTRVVNENDVEEIKSFLRTNPTDDNTDNDKYHQFFGKILLLTKDQSVGPAQNSLTQTQQSLNQNTPQTPNNPQQTSTVPKSETEQQNVQQSPPSESLQATQGKNDEQQNLNLNAGQNKVQQTFTLPKSETEQQNVQQSPPSESLQATQGKNDERSNSNASQNVQQSPPPKLPKATKKQDVEPQPSNSNANQNVQQSPPPKLPKATKKQDVEPQPSNSNANQNVQQPTPPQPLQATQKQIDELFDKIEKKIKAYQEFQPTKPGFLGLLSSVESESKQKAEQLGKCLNEIDGIITPKDPDLLSTLEKSSRYQSLKTRVQSEIQQVNELEDIQSMFIGLAGSNSNRVPGKFDENTKFDLIDYDIGKHVAERGSKLFSGQIERHLITETSSANIAIPGIKIDTLFFEKKSDGKTIIPFELAFLLFYAKYDKDAATKYELVLNTDNGLQTANLVTKITSGDYARNIFYDKTKQQFIRTSLFTKPVSLDSSSYHFNFAEGKSKTGIENDDSFYCYENLIMFVFKSTEQQPIMCFIVKPSTWKSTWQTPNQQYKEAITKNAKEFGTFSVSTIYDLPFLAKTISDAKDANPTPATSSAAQSGEILGVASDENEQTTLSSQSASNFSQSNILDNTPSPSTSNIQQSTQVAGPAKTHADQKQSPTGTFKFEEVKDADKIDDGLYLQFYELSPKSKENGVFFIKVVDDEIKYVRIFDQNQEPLSFSFNAETDFYLSEVIENQLSTLKYEFPNSRIFKITKESNLTFKNKDLILRYSKAAIKSFVDYWWGNNTKSIVIVKDGTSGVPVYGVLLRGSQNQKNQTITISRSGNASKRSTPTKNPELYKLILTPEKKLHRLTSEEQNEVEKITNIEERNAFYINSYKTSLTFQNANP